MKITIFKFTAMCVLMGVSQLFAQEKFTIQPELQNFRQPGYDGLNVFEEPKNDTVPFDGLKVRVGGDFALQLQGINHTSDSALVNLGTNFNLPTANLNLDVQLADGVRMHLRTYLSSRHHNEAWIKGGHIQIDKLDFISDGFLSGFMDIATLKIGLDEINYGDAHFRRSDNARAIYNPFVGNYIMDAFTTEAFGELTVQPGPFLAVAGISNGNLNQSVNIGTKENKLSFYGKLGYDDQINNDLRLRLTGSFLASTGYDNGQYLYSGDRAGARYYWVMVKEGAADNFRSGRFNPGFAKFNAFQINPFVKWKGLEFFGIYEMTMGDQADPDVTPMMQGGSFTQLGGELLYRFGSWDQFYAGGRFNSVSGNYTENSPDISINRFNVGLGWFFTKNVMVKLEYVNQMYSDEGWTGSEAHFNGGSFDGAVFEAVIGF
ncbi:hypothetical protein [Owenweeksia hongkongensis]|uniref:hypothetical protein n=1 Tax=Owenweeksia hongkongensis TaxID=253245 RepID=UPI003A90D504